MDEHPVNIKLRRGKDDHTRDEQSQRQNVFVRTLNRHKADGDLPGKKDRERIEFPGDRHTEHVLL